MKKVITILLIASIIANTGINAFAAKQSGWTEEEDTVTQDQEIPATNTVPDPVPIVGGDITSTNEPEDDANDTTEEPPVTNTVPDPIPIVGGDMTGTNDPEPDDSSNTDNNQVTNNDTVNADKGSASTTDKVENKVENKSENIATTNDSASNATSIREGKYEIVQSTQTAEVVEDDKDASKEESEKDKENKKIQQALKDYAAQLGFTDKRRPGNASQFTHEYAEQPVIGKDSCSPGKLADTTLKEGLDLINMIRKTAGLGEVTLDDMYNEYAQNGAMVMKGTEGTIINGVDYGGLTHFPPKTDNITADQFKLGSTGTRGGNIEQGRTSLTDTILNGYMFDGDPGNILTMGHRRWILNPTMSKVGFGQVEDYNCMYAHDNGNAKERIEDFVTWPAANMPKELMSYHTGKTAGTVIDSSMPWTCQLGNNYKIVPSKDLTITVTYPDGHEFKVPSHKIFCNNQNYGYTNGCITFRADDFNSSNKDFTSFGNNYTVKIDGVLDKNGKATSIEYDVNFFSLFE